MAALARNQSSSCAAPILDIYTAVNGILTDVAQLEYQIFDVTDPLLPVQVYPAILGDRATTDVTQACPTGDKLGTGHYVARWTVPALEVVGTHQIRWFIKLILSSAEQTWAEEFEVLTEVQAYSDIGYCLVSDIRAEGITTAQASDARIQRAINLASRFIDRATGRWFSPREMTISLDGRGAGTLRLDVPIIALSAVSVGGGDPINFDDVRIYNRHLTQNLTSPDDRNDPRVEWVSNDRWHVYPYSARRRVSTAWGMGTQNISLTGIFGYTEYDGSPTGSTPALIRQACIMLTLRYLSPMTSDDWFDEQNRYRITSERTRDQSYNLGPVGGGLSGSPIGLGTGDPMIDSILADFSAPPALGATGRT